MTENAQHTDIAAAGPDLRPLLLRAQDWVASLAEASDGTARTAPTPCDEFDLEHLLLHLVVVFHKSVGLGRDGVDPYAGTHEDPALLASAQQEVLDREIGGRTGAEIAARLRALATGADEAWTDAAMGRQTTLGWGPVLPGAAVVSLYLFETVAHGWDLARSIGADPEAPADVAEAALECARRGLPDDMPRGAENGVPFGPKTEAPEGAGPTTRLAAHLGRPM